MLGARGCQRTIGKDGRVSGVGLHSGEKTEIVLRPAPPESGIRFFKDGRPVDLFSDDAREGVPEESLRLSAIGRGSDRIMTVEHLLAALTGLEITNLRVEVNGPEIPALDGSALGYVQTLKELGIVDQAALRDCYKILEPVFLYDKNSAICIYPAAQPSVAYVLDYGAHPFLGGQFADFALSPEVFETEIAPARTFCTAEEAALLKEKGFGRGATRENTLVISRDGAHAAGLRFMDECARHKVLDILGDLALVGFTVLGRVVGIRSGHALNRRLALKIRRLKINDTVR
jgi:UDP-3-O-acyl N-acetylglucosamine deacetylase